MRGSQPQEQIPSCPHLLGSNMSDRVRGAGSKRLTCMGRGDRTLMAAAGLAAALGKNG